MNIIKMGLLSYRMAQIECRLKCTTVPKVSYLSYGWVMINICLWFAMRFVISFVNRSPAFTNQNISHPILHIIYTIISIAG